MILQSRLTVGKNKREALICGDCPLHDTSKRPLNQHRFTSFSLPANVNDLGISETFKNVSNIHP